MNIEKKLKRLGIKETKEFTKEEKNIVANNVTVSLVMAFPVLKIEQEKIEKKQGNFWANFLSQGPFSSPCSRSN